MRFRYEQRLREQGGEREDLSDMVAEHAAKQSVGNRYFNCLLG